MTVRPDAMGTVIVRRAIPGDTEAIARILAGSFSDLFRAEFGLRQAEITSLLADLYREGLLPMERVRVGLLDGSVEGVIVLSLAGDAPDTRGWMWRALPVFRRRAGWKGAMRAAIGSSLLRYYFAGRTPSRSRGGGYIDSLAVDESARRKGLGRALLQAGCEEARAAGCPSIALHVLASKGHAVRLYESEGFERARERWWLARAADRAIKAVERLTARSSAGTASVLMVKGL